MYIIHVLSCTRLAISLLEKLYVLCNKFLAVFIERELLFTQNRQSPNTPQANLM